MKILKSNINTAWTSLQIIFVCRKVICQARASFDWTRTQSGGTKNSKQYEEIKFQRE